jgi:hypothetical protein
MTAGTVGTVGDASMNKVPYRAPYGAFCMGTSPYVPGVPVAIERGKVVDFKPCPKMSQNPA